MRRFSRRLRALLAALASLVPVLTVALPLWAAMPAPERASTLRRWADEFAAEADVESRSRARRMLEEAVALEPGESANWRLLGRLLLLQGYDLQARHAYERATELGPKEPDNWLGLAAAEKREYLWELDSTRFCDGIAALEQVTRLRPHGAAAWLQLVPLRYEARDLEGAAYASMRALEGWPRLPEAQVAAAFMAYRTGDLALADSLFRAGIPRLAPARRQLFESPRNLPAIAEPDSEAREAGDDERPDDGRPIEAFRALAQFDPDPTSRENEAQLEWWSRVTHALLLFDDPLRPELDARAETYIRYGPPRQVLLNPVGVPLFTSPIRGMGRSLGRDRASLDFPLRAQVWLYPELGMNVLLHDRSLRGHWTQPFRRGPEWPNTPDPGVLARRTDLMAFGDGWLVIPTRPPGSQRLEVSGAFTRFENERGPRVRGQLDVAAKPSDALTAIWLVRDVQGRAVASDTTRPGMSGCDPGGRRVVEFSASLEPGVYDVTISARDTHKRRGFVRRTLEVEPAGAGLGMSDLLVNCGNAMTLALGGTVRLEEAPNHRFALGAEIAVYAEIYRLMPNALGQSHFEYEYSVKRFKNNGDPGPRVAWASRAESTVGSTRRQFVAVNTATLAAGRYRVEVRVRDLVAGTSAARAAEFTLE